MQKIRIDFDNPGLPQHISAVENDSQSRFFQAMLYENGKAYTAPEGAAYSIMYCGFGPQNQGWYDTINDGAGKRAACAVSGNVVTCEIARQALQVPGHVSIVLCVTTGKGYMLKSWPIECDCKNDRYDSTVEIQSFFYVTQISNESWTQAIQAVEELKNTIDPTLSLSGKAADAKATGDAVGELKEDLDNYIDLLDTNILYSKGKFICNSGNGGTWKIFDETIKFYPEKKSKLFLRCGNVTGSTSDRVITFAIYDDKNEIINSTFLTKNSVKEIVVPEDFSYCEMQFVMSREIAIGADVDCVYENIALTVNSPNVTLSNKPKKSELNILPVSTKGNVVSKENRFISDIIDLKSEKITRNLLKVVATICVEKSTATKPGELDVYGIAFELDGHTVNSPEFYEIISSNIFTFSRERKEYYTFYTSDTNCYVTIPNVTNIEEATRWLKNNLPEFWVYLKNPITEKIEKSQLQKYTNEFVASKTINDCYKYNYADFYKTKPPYWILHLDCARKYFSVENIKIIIDRISNVGFNQLNFHFSEHQGFRLQLGNMTIQDEDGISYDLTPCLGGYENPTKWYTQNEMDSIIEYAKSKNIDIVPSFDMPGHLGYILNKFPNFKSDDSTLDITNVTAVKFLKAILVKYLKYFSSRGCKYWNMGFDEIGENGLGFKNYYDSGNYQKIINFSNILVSEIKKYGFIPRMFNDGVYYHDDYNYMFDKDIEICVWKGSSTQANMGNPIKIQKCGYKVINWSGAFYWVLGNANLSVVPEYFDDVDLLYNLTKEYWIYPTPTYGAALSIWCDGYSSVHPNDNGDYILAETENLILAFGKAIKRATF